MVLKAMGYNFQSSFESNYELCRQGSFLDIEWEKIVGYIPCGKLWIFMEAEIWL